ncbi:hypothetical protein Tco_0180448 [Tanacetum coccineum]
MSNPHQLYHPQLMSSFKPMFLKTMFHKKKHIDLVNIISEPFAGIITRSRIRDSDPASASECLYVNFLSKMEPKKLIEALEEERWIIAMQEELTQFEINKQDRDEFISAIGLPICKDVVPLPPKETVRAGLVNEGIVGTDHLGKFDEKADDGFFLGYSLVAKAFKVFNIRRQEMEETVHVTFSEDDEAISQSSTKCLGNTEYFPYIPTYEKTTPSESPILQESIISEYRLEFTEADYNQALIET